MRNRQRAWRGLQSVALVLVALTLLPSLIGLIGAAAACRIWETPATNDLGSSIADPAIQQVVQDIPDYGRLEDATYLTLPEWYVVYSTDEYAAFIADHPPSQFPYFQAVIQYWESWYAVCGVIRGRYPLDGGYQFALVIIGINFTAETMVREVYESSVGQLTEWLSSPELTEEDAYARLVARDYGDFIHMTPWYDFPFVDKLRGVWTETGLWGANPIRKWERKFVLSTDYAIKAFYAWIIRLGANLVYGGPDDLKIYVVAEGVTGRMLTEEPELELVQPIDGERDLVTLTRFEVFSQIVPGLVDKGLRFVEIAGNDEILVTLVAPANTPHTFDQAEYLFDLPILTEPEFTRMAVKVPVAQLHSFLQELQDLNIQLEHIYDY